MPDDHPDLAFSPDSAPWLADGSQGYAVAVECSLRMIGEVAREYGVTERALRFYETKGLLIARREGRSRRYGPEELNRLAMLLKAKKLGFTLSEIRQLFAAQARGSAFDISRRQCVDQIKLLECRKRDIETALVELRRAYTAMYVPLAPQDG